MAINTSSIAHVRLTVTDIERSRQFYESVFGWRVLIEAPESADAATREALSFLFGGVIYDLGGTLIGLRPVAADRFHEDRCGLDHLAFRIASKDELDAAAAHLDELGYRARAHQGHRPVLHPGVPRPGQHRAGAHRPEVITVSAGRILVRLDGIRRRRCEYVAAQATSECPDRHQTPRTQ